MDRRSAALTLIILAMACNELCSTAGAQTSPSSAQTRRFELSATAVGKSQLSRSEVDPLATGMRSLASRTPLLAPTRVETAMPSTAPSFAQTDNARPAMVGSVKQDDTPGAFMHEYNVDWSTWVSTFADRWFYILRGAEQGLGMQFMTPRPALIQFTCYADGTIGNIMLKQSSGVPLYDRLQVGTLMHVVPTANFPSGTKRTSITLIQGWESHQKRTGETDFQPGSFGKDFPAERVRQWVAGR